MASGRPFGDTGRRDVATTERRRANTNIVAALGHTKEGALRIKLEFVAAAFVFTPANTLRHLAPFN